MAPIAQLYCKKLDISNVDLFIRAEPDHIGWQINLNKMDGEKLLRSTEMSASIVRLLARNGIKSVFLLHPCTDGDMLLEVLNQVRPDIFLASADRSFIALDAVKGSGSAHEIMVPIGIPSSAEIVPNYNPMDEVEAFAEQADWYTTDTITEADTSTRFGCSGRTSDWKSMVEVIHRAPRPVVAAGGLTAGNIRALWDLCQPAGFDAHTAVCTDGMPDLEKALAFTRAVRELA